jgi:hypothetical protein
VELMMQTSLTMPNVAFGAVPLTATHVHALVDKIREGDDTECRLMGMSPLEALETGRHSDGECYAVLHDDVPIGAIGWTQEGAVWSLWTELTALQSRLILRVTPQWFKRFSEAAEEAGLAALCNYVWDRNLPAIKWLKASGAVDFREDLSEVKDGKRLVPFVVRPSMEIR